MNALPLDIPLTPVDSSQIAAIGFDASSSTLAVQFKTRGAPSSVYHYPDVPESLYDEFMGSSSKGKFFGQHIKPRPDYVRVR